MSEFAQEISAPGLYGLSSAPPQPSVDGRLQALENWRGAYPALGAWLNAGVPPAVALRRLGLTLWTARRPDIAAQALQDSVSADPTDAAAWLDLGFCLRALRATGAALDAFVCATQQAPGNARAWLALGLAAKEAGDVARAEAAFARGLALDGDLDDAAYSLGLIHFEARRYAAAAAHWQGLAVRGYSTVPLHLGLGQCQFFLGEFGAAAGLLAAHLAAHPEDEAVRRRYALVCFLDGALSGGPEAARDAYAKAAGAWAEPIEKIARSGFLLLASYGHGAAALAVAHALVTPGEHDPIRDHHVAALKGDARLRASNEYVSMYFDKFADTFDDQMVALGYNAPERLVTLIAGLGGGDMRALDIGCGSGAAAPLLRPRCARLVGVDLSANMIEKARLRGLYDELAVADMLDFLASHRDAFDLVFAADALIYLGDLGPLLQAAEQALAPGGRLAFSVEITKDAPYVLQTSGRFAHSPGTVIASAAGRFTLSAREQIFLRREANQSLYGELIVLEKPRRL